jgi:hypothetical protein
MNKLLEQARDQLALSCCSNMHCKQCNDTRALIVTIDEYLAHIKHKTQLRAKLKLLTKIAQGSCFGQACIDCTLLEPTLCPGYNYITGDSNNLPEEIRAAARAKLTEMKEATE